MIKQTSLLRLWVPVIILATLAAIIALSGSNKSLFLSLNKLSEGAPVMFWATATLLADAATGFALMTLALRKHSKLIYWAIMGGILCAVVIRIIKVGANLPRPAGILSIDDFQVIGKAITSKSFPSGHTATAFFVAAIVTGFHQSRWLLIGSLLVASILAFSRIAVGVHWPIDVCIGAIIGWSIGILTVRFAQNSKALSQKQHWFAIAICLTGSVIFLSMDFHLPDIDVIQYSIGIICLITGLTTAYLEFRQPRDAV